MIIKIKNKELIAEITDKVIHYPKYATQIINLANQNSQATRPKNVGQMTELIQKCPFKTYAEWKNWYLKRYPDAIRYATRKTYKMVKELKKATMLINEAMVKNWVEDLVLAKTFAGLKFQEIILKRVSSMRKMNYKLSSSTEEKKGNENYP